MARLIEVRYRGWELAEVFGNRNRRLAEVIRNRHPFIEEGRGHRFSKTTLPSMIDGTDCGGTFSGPEGHDLDDE